MKLTRFLSRAEYIEVTDDAISRGYYRNDRRILLPGWGWHMPWYYDPLWDSTGSDRKPMLQEKFGQEGFLSVHYWRDWAKSRPPICIVAPNGQQWEIDRKSSNGTGWTVTGSWPNLTATPSINLDGYHGWLSNGEFSKDLEGRGPDGVWPYGTELDPQEALKLRAEL